MRELACFELSGPCTLLSPVQIPLGPTFPFQLICPQKTSHLLSHPSPSWNLPFSTAPTPQNSNSPPWPVSSKTACRNRTPCTRTGISYTSGLSYVFSWVFLRCIC